MAVIITPQKDIEAYFASPDLNQSTLKSLENGFGSFMAEVYKRNKAIEENKPAPEHFLVGGGVDTILTGELGEFEKQYFTSTLEKKPSDVEISIIESVFDELRSAEVLDQIKLEDCGDLILAAAEEFEWQSRYKPETKINKIIEVGKAYFEDLKVSAGKIILTSALRDKIDSICHSLITNERTKKFFDRDAQETMKNVDFYYQLPIYFTYRGLKCKALLDLVVVVKDLEGNIVHIEAIDLKTMSGDTLNFLFSLKQRRYDIQAMWYTIALMEHFKVGRDVFKPFKFIVESTTNVGSPLVYEITPETLGQAEVGMDGGSIITTLGREIVYPDVKGIKQLIDDYIYYTDQGFVQDRILDENSGNLKLDWHKGILTC